MYKIVYHARKKKKMEIYRIPYRNVRSEYRGENRKPREEVVIWNG